MLENEQLHNFLLCNNFHYFHVLMRTIKTRQPKHQQSYNYMVISMQPLYLITTVCSGSMLVIVV